jgi:hypothetical protein
VDHFAAASAGSELQFLGLVRECRLEVHR